MVNMEKISELYKNKGGFYILDRFCLYFFRIKFISDINILKILNEWRIYYKYRKKYIKKAKIEDYENLNKLENIYSEKDFYIWSLWLQGENNAPTLVKKCYASVKKHCPNHRLIVLNENTINDYISIPDFILNKYKKGIISQAHFSDLIRMFLLDSYGGLWIDSTCYFTNKLPNVFFENDIFCFKMPICYNGPIKASNWFIYAKKNNQIIKHVKNILIDFWKKNNYVEEYLFFHIIMSVVIDSSVINKKMWNKMPYFNNDNPHILNREIYDNYSSARFESLCNLSSVHKLSNKNNLQYIKSNTFYNYILNKED